MLGRSAGLTEAQIQHIGDDPLPAGVYDAAEAAIVRYARASTLTLRIDQATYDALAAHFTTPQILDITMTVGLSNLVNRFHATFLTDLDELTLAEAEAGDQLHGACPLPRPPVPRD